MSAPKFRTGDVVSALGYSTEGVVVDIVSDAAFPFRVSRLSGGTSPFSFRARELTLLRRPVQPEDRLRRIGHDHGGVPVCLMGEDGVRFSNGWANLGGWEHIDGTPIDPPADIRKADTLPAPAGDGHTVCAHCERAEGHAESCPTYGSHYTNAPNVHYTFTIPAPPGEHNGWDGAMIEGEHGPIRVTTTSPPPITAPVYGWAQLNREEPCSTCGVQACPGASRFKGVCPYAIPLRDIDAPAEVAKRIDAVKARIAERRSSFPPPAELPLTAARLARALWEVDPEVMAFVDRVAERPTEWDERWEARRLAAEGRAWDRDELGARTRWTAVAEAAVERLRSWK